MKIVLIRSMQGSDKSLIFCKDNKPFTPWHNHPEYELALAIKGREKEWWETTLEDFMRMILF